ncbi:MAG: hypothetical protein ABJO05_01515, partial [Roseibium sp.]
RKTMQIVLYGRIRDSQSSAWQFRRTATAKLSRRGSSEFDELARTAELPLVDPDEDAPSEFDPEIDEAIDEDGQELAPDVDPKA